MKSYVFIKNTVIMTFTALILRTAGIILRVWLANKIGSEGIGLYQLIFSVYTLVSAFAASGICTAVTRLAAEQLPNGKTAVKRVFKNATMLTLIIAVLSAIIVYFFSDLISVQFLKDVRAAKSLKILSFSLPFMGISSCIRGYFTALRKMTVPSATQILEQIVRIAVIITLLRATAEKGLEYSAAVILFADTVAEIASCVIGYLLYLKDIKKIPNKEKAAQSFVPQILKIAVPISAGRYITTGLKTFENIIVPNMLAIFSKSRALALSQFGMLRGMAIPIMFFPSSFLMSVSTMLIPEMSEDKAQNHTISIGYKASKTVNMTLKASIFIATVFFAAAYEIGFCVYKSTEVGYIIRFLSPIIPFMYLESVIDGLNKGLDQQNYTLMFNIIDSVLRIVVIYTLVPHFGLNGFLWLMIVSNIATSMLNFLRTKKAAKVKVDIKNSVLKPIFAGVFSILVNNLIFKTEQLNILFAVLKSATVSVIFIIIMLLLKGFEEEPYINKKP